MAIFEISKCSGESVITVGDNPKHAVESFTRLPVVLICFGYGGEVYETPDGRQYVVFVC